MEIFFIRLLQFMLAISLLVLLHELGHFTFAKLFKVRVTKFYLFFNPKFHILSTYDTWVRRLLKLNPEVVPTKEVEEKDDKGETTKTTVKEYVGTEYGLGWLPLGGYCAIDGMIDETNQKLSEETHPWEFRVKPVWQRLLIMIGGVLVNFLLALFIYSMILYHWGDTYIPVKDMTLGMKFNTEAKALGFQDGDIYAGIFENGRIYKNSFAKYCANGDNYYGTFKNGKMAINKVYKNLGDDRRYEGDYENGKFTGMGILNFSNGNRYEGSFSKNSMNSLGKLYYNNGDFYGGIFENNSFKSGIIKCKDGQEYNGYFKNNKLEGKGTLIYKNCYKYIGQFKENKREGEGILYNKSGDIYKGNFSNNKREGKGTEYYIDGSRYEGEFKNDKKVGKGIYYSSNEKEERFYSNGKKINK